MIFNILGLFLDLIGVLLLFRFGILPNNLWEHLLMDSGMSEKDEKKHKLWSKIAVAIIFIGFFLQLFGTVIQYQNVEQNNKLDHLKIDLGNEQNITSGLIGNLEIRYNENRLSYKMIVSGTQAQFSNITRFWVFLEDTDGFKISDINEKNEPENENITRHFYGDSLTTTIKNQIDFEKLDFNEIGNWEFKISKD